MIPPVCADSCARAFDRAFRRRAPGYVVEAESDAHRPFLEHLFIACSPLDGILPAAMMQAQARTQYASHRFEHPHAMRRIATLRGAPVARIVLDWAGESAVQGVDVAVLPAFRSTAVGLALLRSWVEVADLAGRPSRLSVLRGNPAARIYGRLGFVAEQDDGRAAMVRMLRAPMRRNPTAPF